MKYLVALVTAFTFFATSADAQKTFATRNGKITFTAQDDDDVKAVNNEVTSRLTDNGQLSFSLLVKGFKFKLAEMQDHFNNKYIESQKFPRADFKGALTSPSAVNFAKDGVYKVSAKGDLSMHGITKNITVNGTVTVKGGKPSATARFTITLKDFGIDATGVADKVDVEVSCVYQ